MKYRDMQMEKIKNSSTPHLFISFFDPTEGSTEGRLFSAVCIACALQSGGMAVCHSNGKTA